MGSSLGWARGGVNRHGRASSGCAKMPGGSGGSHARLLGHHELPALVDHSFDVLHEQQPAPTVDESQRDGGRLARLAEPRLPDPDGRWLLGRVGKWMTVVKNAASGLSRVWRAGCEAAWDLIFARARVAESALGADFKSHHAFSS
jgi:hypothetical protein